MSFLLFPGSLAAAMAIQAVTLWGEEAPAHSITAILITEDQATVVTGSQEGQICLWHLSSELKVSSKQMLFGHNASVTCLAKARDFEKQPYVVSAAENGGMCIWNVACGQCVESTRLPFRHTAICYYHSSWRMTGEGWLLCCGQYANVLILDAKTLAVLHTLSSSHASDWISCMCLVRSPRIQEDSLVAVSVAGDLKVWDLSSSVNRIQEKQNIPERESKSLGCAPCHAIRFCIYTERLLLVVFSTCWKVYDYCDFSLLWTEFSPHDQRFAGGEILAAHRLIICTQNGCGFIYQLLNSGLSRSVQPWNARALRETVCPLLLCLTAIRGHQSLSYVMGFMNERKEPFYKVLYSGETSGRITLWHIPDVPVSTLDGSPREIPIAASWTLQNSFDSRSPRSTESLCGVNSGYRGAAVASAVYIPGLDELVCGCEDGEIFAVLALPAVKARLLEGASSLKDAQPHRLLTGHSSSVTVLLHLHSQSARFDPSWLVSGSQDSQVIWWDLFTGEMLHCFSLQAGPVSKLLLSSEHYRVSGQRLVCCVCADHSVMLLHLQGRTCILQARKHLFPVKTLRWHPVENLLVVGCENDSVYVWDIETGTLERHETGGIARMILACCEESVEESLLSVMQKAAQKPKSIAGQPANSCKSGHLPCSSFTPQEQRPHQLVSMQPGPHPFTILPMKMKPGNSLFHVLLFDLERLAEQLRHSPRLSGPESPGSFHGCGSPKRRKSTAERRTLMLKRSRISGSLSPLEGQGGPCAGEQGPGDKKGPGSSQQSAGIRRHKKAKGSQKMRRRPSGKIDTNVVDAAKLLLSCLLPWGTDKELDEACVQHLGVLRPAHPVSFGLISRDRHLSLALPEWSSSHHLREANLFSCKVLDLCGKYVSVAEGQSGRTDGRRGRSLTLLHLLGRICLVQRIIGPPLGKARCYLTNTVCVFSDTFGILDCESENCLLVKLISCWKEQSVEVGAVCCNRGFVHSESRSHSRIVGRA
uniref:WD repeat domain 72 n=1 Tax=Salvator merianae TaxID=96440 RepID=A0A8D0BS24_SALMN